STTSDGKIVIGVKSRTSDRADCSVLQMVDLNTGKAGWKTTIKKNGTGDMLSDIGLTISGNTVIAGPTSNFNAYQVSDGKELFGTPAESCKIFAFAGGPKLIAAANCSTDDVKNPQHQVLELDRVSGKAKMTYQPPRGWKVEKVYSVDPLIVRLGLGDMSKKQHAIAAISKSGKLLSQMIPSTDDVLVASCGNTFALFDTRLEGCSGVVADANTFYMATKPKGEYGSAPTNKVIAFDLGTGEPKWTANAPVGRVVSPIRMEDGKLLLHQEPRHDMPGAVLSLPPTGGTASVLLQHPEGANRIENGFYSKYIRYEGGRSFILSKRANRGMGKKEMAQTTALVFSK
ncbi:hypothetical protein ACPCUK_37375, partial [Streptomyces arboris]